MSGSIIFLDEIAVTPATDVRNTHSPCNVQTRKNMGNDFFHSLNLLSSVSFSIRKNKKLPSLNAQIKIKTAINKERKSDRWPIKLLL